MAPDALETLRQVNEYLSSALVRLRPDRKESSTIRPHDFSDILSQLLRASECLRGVAPHTEAAAALEKEALEYRGNLQKLKDLLPDLHGRLLAERSRLETARNHVVAAVAWARASEKTL